MKKNSFVSMLSWLLYRYGSIYVLQGNSGRCRGEHGMEIEHFPLIETVFCKGELKEVNFSFLASSVLTVLVKDRTHSIKAARDLPSHSLMLRW